MAEQGWGSTPFVAEQFRRYYGANAERIRPPSEIGRREFGFLPFEGKAMVRHVAFGDDRRLRRYLRENAPAHAYYSAAYYSAPDAEMERKGWLGSDLVFDIDADHIDTPCKADHDRWTCRSCGEKGAGKVPDACPRCGKATFEEKTWLCDRCLETAKYETQKLLDILVQDFGFSPSEELEVNFTGNRGYHVHVAGPHVTDLDQLARREIVDYITGVGMKPEHQGFARMRDGPSALAEGGWRGRASRALYDYLSRATAESVEGLKLGRAASRSIQGERGAMLKVLEESHPSGLLRFIDPKSLGILMDAAISEEASSIDTVVTTDIHRLIRLPDTLHGKTGWIAQSVPMDELEDYDPPRSAIAFSGEAVGVYVRRSPRFRIGDERYGPFDAERVELPLAAAVFLLCKKAARVER
jgi:DNA primase small subunit